MLEGNRSEQSNSVGLATAVTTTLFITFVVYLCYDNYHADQRSAAAETEKINAILACSESLNTTREAVCITKASEANYHHTQAAYDLQAQQQMSEWALLMLFVTGVGVFFVARTLQATSETLKVTKDANKAAWKAAEETKAAADAQIGIQRDSYRGLLRPINAHFVIQDTNNGNKNIILKFGMVNNGSSFCAMVCASGGVFRVARFPVQRNEHTASRRSNFPLNADEDGPISDDLILQREISAEEFEKIKRRELVVCGIIGFEYIDLTGTRRFTTHLFRPNKHRVQNGVDGFNSIPFTEEPDWIEDTVVINQNNETTSQEK
ncbi:MAG: hypothetical protein AAGK25_07990 [Pseudomonadota bacterium]